VSLPPAWIAVGRITRAHGVKGEVAVHVLTEVGSRFDPGEKVYLEQDESRPLSISSSRPHRDRLLVTFEEIPDREAAESLHGHYLFVAATSSPLPPDGAYWAHQLIGCRVSGDDGRDMGVVAEVIHTEANDVWVVVGDGTQTLVPALKDVVQSVDVPGRRIVVRVIEGLTAP
jgi:16S rRNA processing protein RimM